MFELVKLSKNPLFLLITAFVLTVILIMLLSKFSKKLGLLDVPGGRKKHDYPIPLIGGIAIFITISFLWLPYYKMSVIYLFFWIACTSLIVVCIIDDKYSLSAKTRIFSQGISVCLMVFFGKTILLNLGNLFGLGLVPLNWFSVAFTVFALIGIVNAVNMMDGIDGLTGSISSVELSLLLFLSMKSSALPETMLIIICLGSVFAFLLFNFPSSFAAKRKIFLGDTGSMLIGLILAWLCVRFTQEPYAYPTALMLWILALPIMDALHLIVNRITRGVSPFKPDRRHIHHILLQLHYTPKQTSLILGMLSLVIGQTGIFLFLQGTPNYILFYGALMVFLLYSIMAYLLKKRVTRQKYAREPVSRKIINNAQ